MTPEERATAILIGFDDVAESADYITPISREALCVGIAAAIRDAVAEEQEACAAVAEGVGETDPHNHLYEGSRTIAAVIRARGKRVLRKNHKSDVFGRGPEDFTIIETPPREAKEKPESVAPGEVAFSKPCDPGDYEAFRRLNSWISDRLVLLGGERLQNPTADEPAIVEEKP